MAVYRIAEIFGYDVGNHTAAAIEGRAKKWCPFRDARCNKGRKDDPTGICSLVEDEHLATVCPNRFVQDSQIFLDAGRMAFGTGVKIAIVPELSILRVSKATSSSEVKQHRIGKVDYLLAKLDANDTPMDFAALEVQAVYFSGHSMRPAFNHFIKTGKTPENSGRRPDWRSSAQKRLMPQLSLKVPVFRRWGKKFFVAIDSHFFAAFPKMKTISSPANSEVTWLVYPFSKDGQAYQIGTPKMHFTTWDDVVSGLREGEAPEPPEILADIQRKRQRGASLTLTT